MAWLMMAYLKGSSRGPYRMAVILRICGHRSICPPYTLFMVVPIFNSMLRIDKSLLEAAYDTGASTWADAYKCDYSIEPARDHNWINFCGNHCDG